MTAIEYNELMGGRRKRGAAIAHELAQRQEDLERYRPMPTKAKGTELEKQRLQNINMFKGGKALPDELTLAPIQGSSRCMTQCQRQCCRAYAGAQESEVAAGVFGSQCK